MVVSPSAKDSAEFVSYLANIERQFMKRGLTVISPAITARVSSSKIDPDKDGGRGGSGFDAVGRALILAKETNSDAVLQIGVFEFFRSDQIW